MMKANMAGGVLWLFGLTLFMMSHKCSGRQPAGIEDTVAVVGRIFNITIPENAFTTEPPHSGHMSYEVAEAGSRFLPAWLHFTDGTFLGVPPPEDVGRIYISVKTMFKKENGELHVSKDVFSIEITESSGEDSCSGEVETMASVVVLYPYQATTPLDKIQFLQAASSYLGFSIKTAKLLPVKDKALDAEAIVAGGGNAKVTDPGDVTRIQFPVGCAGRLASENEALVKLLEVSSANGSLAESLGHPVIGWQVVNDASRRQKRYVTPCRGTPIPEVRATIHPPITHRIWSGTTEITPSSRVVPAMASPDVLPPTNGGHPHRHHHGVDNLHRENFPKPSDIRATPTWQYSGATTYRPVAGTPVPTPTLYPDRPTAIYPSRVSADESGPTLPLPPDVSKVHQTDFVSRWYAATTDYATIDPGPTRSIFSVEPTKTIPQKPNFKPTVNSRIKKLSLVCGKAWSFAVPRDTFIDLEDGNTRDLKLIFTTSERTSIPATSWIQFDPENQLLYALPLIDNVGKHEFVLEAMDSEGASTFDRIELNVWQHPSFQSLTHSFNMSVRYSKWQYPVGIEWQIEILNRLALFFGDPDHSKLVVISVTLDPVRIIWSNDTLALTPCPIDTILNMYRSFATGDHQPTKELKKIMGPEFRIQEITLEYKASCEGAVTSPIPPPNFSPKLRRPIQTIDVVVGDVFSYSIPDDTFYDFEDGGTRNLRLALFTADELRISETSWVQFDHRIQEMYGVPSDDDVGRKEYKISATDADGHTTTDIFELHVHRLANRMKPPVEFSLQIDHDYNQFVADAARKTLVAFKLARLYGDAMPQHIVVTSITRGSVIYAWSNKTLPNDYCPKDRIEQLFSYLANEDGGLTLSLIHVMQPEFKVVRAGAVFTGVCIGGVPPTFVALTTTVGPTSLLPEDVRKDTSEIPDDVFVTTVLPAIVIAAILLVAAIVVYCLYWKKRKAVEDKEFVGGGVPVVFAEELEEQKPDPGKAPAIMKNEKPPLSTDYLFSPFRRGAAAVRESVTGMSSQHQQEMIPQQGMHRRPQQHQPYPSHQSVPRGGVSGRRGHHRGDEPNESLYQPPPPFAHDREGKSMRPKASHGYSRHPTYVPP